MRQISEERREVQELLASMRERTKEASAENASEKHRVTSEQERLLQLQATLEAELEEARRQHRGEVDRWKEERRRLESALADKSGEADRDRVSVAEEKKDLTRRQADWGSRKAAEEAQIEAEKRRLSDGEAKLATARCSGMEEQARLAIVKKATEKEAAQLAAEKGVFKEEQAPGTYLPPSDLHLTPI